MSGGDDWLDGVAADWLDGLVERDQLTAEPSRAGRVMVEALACPSCASLSIRPTSRHKDRGVSYWQCQDCRQQWTEPSASIGKARAWTVDG